MSLLDGTKAVAFDLDDTLCAYWDAAKMGLRLTFDSISHEELTADDWMEHWATAFQGFCKNIKAGPWYAGYLKQGEPSRTELMRLTLLQAGIDDPTLAARLSTTYAAQRDASLQLFPESLDVLDALKSAGFSLALITNGPADIQRQEIATCGLEGLFELIQIEGEMGFGKPDPRVFKMTEVHFSAGPDEILMVGNSYGHDIRPAIERGWKTAWVRRPSDVAPSAKKPEEMPDDAPEPDLILNDLRLLLMP